MAYGIGADEKIVRQFRKVCELSGMVDDTTMTKKCSRNIRKFFWENISEFETTNLKLCEEAVFSRLMNKKKEMIVVDGAHVEAYLTEMAHEITKLKREDPNMVRNDPRVTLTKALLEKIIRETKIFITGTVQHMDPKLVDDPTRTAANKQYQFKKPEFPKAMKQMYDIRQRKSIVTVKRDYGNLS